MAKRWLQASMALAFALPLCGQARADLCRRPDGSYTNQCSADDQAVDGGTVNWGSSAAPRQYAGDAAQPAATPAPAALAPPATDERYWRDRASEALKELRQAERLLVKARQDYAECRARQRAGLGIGRSDACKLGELEAAERTAQEARTHLEDGLVEECRRSPTCRPGWVR
jgi:hypothetical protein